MNLQKKFEFCFKIFVINIFFSWAAFQTGLKKNVLDRQLFLDLIRFMFGRFLYCPINPETVYSSRECVWVEKLCLFGIFIKSSLKVFPISTSWDRILSFQQKYF